MIVGLRNGKINENLQIKGQIKEIGSGINYLILNFHHKFDELVSSVFPTQRKDFDGTKTAGEETDFLSMKCGETNMGRGEGFGL